MALALALTRSLALDGVWRRLRALNFDLPLALALTVVAAIHMPSIDGFFHGDDFVQWTDLVSEPPLRHLEQVYTFSDSNFYWRPLGQTYDAIVYQLFGLSPVAFHVGSLVIFLGTLLLLHQLVRGWKLPRGVAIGAVLMFGFFPSHAVSVMWITNTPRLLAVFFFMASLCMVQRAATTRRPSDEVLAWLAFLAAGLSDETALALAPLPVLFALVLRPSREHLGVIAWRAVAYLGLAAALVPLQFMFTTNDEPRLADYKLGLHVFEQTWALASQLSLPLNSGKPLAESFGSMGPFQWTAGALAIAAGSLLLLFGSWRMRFLVCWAGLAIAPFTLWDVHFTAPRYVYMAAIPFSIAVSWVVYSVWMAAFRIRLPRFLPIAAAGLAAIALVAVGSYANMERNKAWDRETEPYRELAIGLKEAMPEVDPGSRIILYYGVWEGFPLWPEAVVRTIYKDETLDAVNVSREFAEEDGSRRRANDVVVFYNGGKFIIVPPSVASAR